MTLPGGQYCTGKKKHHCHKAAATRVYTYIFISGGSSYIGDTTTVFCSLVKFESGLIHKPMEVWPNSLTHNATQFWINTLKRCPLSSFFLLQCFCLCLWYRGESSFPVHLAVDPRMALTSLLSMLPSQSLKEDEGAMACILLSFGRFHFNSSVSVSLPSLDYQKERYKYRSCECV